MKERFSIDRKNFPGPVVVTGAGGCIGSWVLSLLARGLTQHLQLDANMIPTAKALKTAGSPVIMMQGVGGTWPSSLAGAPSVWAHLLDADFHPSEGLHACPAITKGSS